MKSARELAFRSLLAWIRDGKYSNLEMDATLRESPLSPEDRGLYARLYLGVTEKKITLDYLLARFSTRPLGEIEDSVLCLLELGAYQILYMDRIPDRAAIYETVELGKKYCRGASAYLNAVLRALSAQKDGIDSLLALPGKKGLSLRYGYPRWMVGLWQEAYGKEVCEAILAAQNVPAGLCLRVNTLRITVEEFCKGLGEIPFHRADLCPCGVIIDANLPLASIPGFEEGLFFVQDAAAQHAVAKLGAEPEHRVLDLCAAPGGKSFGAAMDMEGRGEILAMEYHENRLPLIEEGARRLGIDIVTARQNDATVPREDLKGAFDRVICDVPCSGLGTIAKKPDIRHKKKEDPETLLATQRAILESGATAVKIGGRLLYATCTLNPNENERITDAFLARHPEFVRVGNHETLFPKGGENDGFFCDLLEKIHE